VKSGPLSFAPVAKSADPSVVTIYTLGEAEERSLFAHRGGGSGGRVAKGLGTGFIVQKDGVIITNNHVIDGAETILVQLSDERRLPGRVAGRDPRTDIAVVKIDDAKDLPAIALGDSDALDVGDWVVAIGNPFGLSHTVSAGIVSAKGRGRDDVPLDPSGYYSFIQTDASINPGNSGGPLLNLKGEVVGMNSAIRGGGAQGIGFAIPINMVKQILPTLLRDGHLTRSALGVRIRDARDLSPEDRTQLKLTDEKGAVVETVEPGGPAARAKLEVGDLIMAFDGQPIDRSSHLQWRASTTGVGKTVTLRVMRAGKAFDLNVVLGELKEPRRPAALRLRPQRDGDDLEDPTSSSH
jgi:serine protease Do